MVNTGCSCLFESTVEILWDLQEYSAASELKIARKMISTQESGSKEAFQQRLARGVVFCLSLGGRSSRKGWVLGLRTQEWLPSGDPKPTKLDQVFLVSE